MSQPLMKLRGAAATLERQRSLKRCRHLIESWSSQRLETLESCIESLVHEDDVQNHQSLEIEERINEMFIKLNEDALNFQDLYYNERRHIAYLDQQRCSNFEEKDSIIN